MKLIKMQSTKGATIYVNPETVAIVSPHASLVNVTNVTFASGMNLEVNGAASEVAPRLGYERSFSV